MHNDFGFANALAGSLDQAAWTERWFENEDSVAAAGFRFDEGARGLAADLLVRSPHEYDAFGKSGLCFLQGFKRKKSLDNASLHVKGAGAIHLVTSHTVGHFDDGAGGIDGVIVAQDEKLRPRRSNAWRPDDAEMVSAVLLANDLDKRPAQQPFVGQEATAAVGALFVQSGRFQDGQLTKDIEHAGEFAAEQGEQSLWE